MDVQELADLEDSQFESVIIANAHPPNRDPEVWAALTDPNLIDRTRDTLTTLYQRNMGGIIKRRDEHEAFRRECRALGRSGWKSLAAAQAEYEERRRRATNFGRTMQNALAVVKETRRNINRATNHQTAQDMRERLRELAQALQKHQVAHARIGGVAEQHDYELWQALDRIRVPLGPDSKMVSLRSMLDVYWTDVQPVSDEESRRTQAERVMRSAPAGQSAMFSGVPRARHVHNDKGLAS